MAMLQLGTAGMIDYSIAASQPARPRLSTCTGPALPPCCSWVGDARRVVAMAKTVVGLRLHPDTAALAGVRVPDHVDVLAEMACGAQAHMVFSAVTGGRGCAAMVWGGLAWRVQIGCALCSRKEKAVSAEMCMLAVVRVAAALIGCCCTSVVAFFAREERSSLLSPGAPQGRRESLHLSSGCTAQRERCTWMWTMASSGWR